MYKNVTSVSAKPTDRFAPAFWNSGFSLHDCRATKIETRKNDLVFTFENGFWIIPETPETPVCATDTAATVFHMGLNGIAEPEVCVYEEKTCGIVCRELRFADFAALINNGAAFEFVNQYFNFAEVLFRGYFHTEDNPGGCRCDLRMELAGMDFYWNRINPERRW